MQLRHSGTSARAATKNNDDTVCVDCSSYKEEKSVAINARENNFSYESWTFGRLLFYILGSVLITLHYRNVLIKIVQEVYESLIGLRLNVSLFLS